MATFDINCPIKLFNIVSWPDRVKFAWLCLTGKICMVGMIILPKDFYINPGEVKK